MKPPFPPLLLNWLTLCQMMSQVSIAVASSYLAPEWSTWSTCSRTCGGGVSSRTRLCQDRLSYSLSSQWSNCTGHDRQHRLCNKEKCPPGSRDYTDEQCSVFNHRRIAGHRTVEWLAVEDHPQRRNPCELRCRTRDSTMTYSFGKMADGTACGQSRVCIDGRCIDIGCNGMIGSTVRADMCGVCGGRNRSCVQVQQMFSSTQGDLWKYTAVTVIPSGATNIHIEEHTRNSLSLWDHWPVSKPSAGPGSNTSLQIPSRDIPPAGKTAVIAGGVRFSHKVAPDGSETLTAKGPTKSAVTLAVYLVQTGTPKVRYEYWIPKEGGASGDVTKDVITGIPDVDNEGPTPSTKDFYRRARLPWSSPLDNRIPFSEERNSGTARRKSLFPANGVLKQPYSRWVANDSRRAKHKPRKPKLKKGRCPLCHRAKNQLHHFCKGDIVIRASVLALEHIDGSLRYDVAIMESYRNILAIQQREFLWTLDARCPCPKLRVGRDYIITAHALDDLHNKESRLVVDNTSFVRRFTERRHKQLERLRKQQTRRCNQTT